MNETQRIEKNVRLANDEINASYGNYKLLKKKIENLRCNVRPMLK